MLINFSSSLNDSLLVAPNFSINSTLSPDTRCFFIRSNSIIFSLFNITNIFLLLPLSIFILHHGVQQSRKSRSTSSAPMSHSDSFTYHLVTMEIIGVFGCFLNVCAIYTGHFSMLTAGLYLLSLTYYGEMFFHVLTCLERYLAVVHPVTYLSLRKERGIRIRNICIGCVWLLSLIEMGFHQDIAIVNLFVLILSLAIVSFCSLSVLCVLIRPGPGGRERVDQSKQRALRIIVVILGVLAFRFLLELVLIALYASEDSFVCVIITWTLWLYLPNSVVLPLLFLLTKKKLKRACICWKRNRN